ncbi:hypothetical protein [Pseudomonas sp. OTU5201]|uniref:hypothetical protein n=1 Tax=Pseudomonas sp. OTU5201 TaxID=3043850 RepID=UPI00313A9DEB
MNSLVPVLAALTLAATAVFAASEAIMSPARQPTPDAIGELLISRDENALNACDIDLYVQNELVAQIAPGQSVSIPVPAGEVALRVAQKGSGYCAGQYAGSPQSTIIQPGEVRHLHIVQSQHEVFLAPAAD